MSGYKSIAAGSQIPENAESNLSFATDQKDGIWAPIKHCRGVTLSDRHVGNFRVPVPGVACGCGKHEIVDGADPYRAHNDWLEEAGGWGTPKEEISRGIKPASDRTLTVAVEIQHEDFV